MKKAAAVVVLLSLAPLRGLPANADPVRTLLSVPSASGAVASSRFIDGEMHYAGTPGDERLAVWMAQRLRAFGFRTTIESFAARVPVLRRISVEILSHPVVRLDLRERPIPVDPDGSRPDAGIPFNGWSGSGTVTAALVDVGNGLDADYRALSARHESVRGKIALVRYGAEFRGLLAARAQRNGAAGVIFYNAPASGKPTYPNGPYRPLGSVQRGSLGGGITIPVLPVSAWNAQRLLRTHAPIRMSVDEPFVWRRLWNTVGVLSGTHPSQEVVLGGHRDAWVYGVTDNGDGVSTLLETARALGALARTGWRPRRSIVIAGWDGEEIGELGSTAYVRMHRDRLRSGCVAYINVDESESGQFFVASAAAALSSFVVAATANVPDPRRPHATLKARWQAQRGGVVVEAPGGGSDFEPFLYDAGVPIVDGGFAGPFGVYHSAFDDLRYAQTEADPGFVNHRALAQLLALEAYRLADEPLRSLYHLVSYADTMRDDVASVPAQYSGALAPLRTAIDAFAVRAASSHPSDGVMLDAVARLDALCYGRNGYAAVPLPLLSAALATNDGGKVGAAASAMASQLGAVTREIET
ncbi:MAG: M28 family peptidase [Candidatus Tyrphobacter sp.]